MALAVRYADAPPLDLPHVDGLVIVEQTDPGFIARLQDRAIEHIAARFQEGHRAYVAYMNSEPAAFGWVATRTATIGELDARFTIAPTERYLWNFVTLPAYRGRGIYPRLLAYILDAEEWTERFWIAYAPENHASAAGIMKAGFEPVAELSFDAAGAPAVRALTPGGGTLAAEVLGIREVESELTQCWRCIRAGRLDSTCRTGECCCDYQVPDVAC